MANIDCSKGKFQDGVDSNGDITCATPSGNAPPDIWYARYDYTDTPQNADTTLATLSLPAGSFLVQAAGTAEDDGAGNGNVEMSCHFDPAGGATPPAARLTLPAVLATFINAAEKAGASSVASNPLTELVRLVERSLLGQGDHRRLSGLTVKW